MVTRQGLICIEELFTITITLSPVIAKLFEYVLLECFGDQLSSDELQFGFKKNTECSHALFTFKQTTKYFVKKAAKFIVHLLMPQRPLTKYYIMVCL